MADRNLTDLDPRFRPIALEIQIRAPAALVGGSRFVITETWRDAAGQNAAASTGHSNAGAGHSPHNSVDSLGNPCSRAFDFTIFDASGQPVTNGADPRYLAIGRLAVICGAAWGGNWTMEHDHCEPDFDHIQMINWRLLPIYIPAVPTSTAGA